MNVIVNTSAIFGSKENESKCSEEGDCCIPRIAGGGRNFPAISATVTQNKTVSRKLCQSDFCRFLSPTFNGGVGVYIHMYKIFFLVWIILFINQLRSMGFLKITFFLSIGIIGINTNIYWY